MTTTPAIDTIIKEEAEGFLAAHPQADDGSYQVAGIQAPIRRFFGKYVKEAIRERVTAPPKKTMQEPMPEAPGVNEISEMDKLPMDAAQPPPAPITRVESAGRLDTALPAEVRVHGGKVNAPGQPALHQDGKRYLDRDLDVKGKARLQSNEQVVTLWDEALDETPGAREALARIAKKSKREGMPKGVEFWNKALALSDRARYWYEISSEYFRSTLPDLSIPEMNTFMRVVAATSPQADPHANLRRAIGVYSQHLRNEPITMDLTTPETVAQALVGDGVSGPKVNNFGDTFQYLQGNNPNPPLSTNDRQVASSFGLEGDDIAANPALYEALSRFYIKMRDTVNAGNVDEPYQSWQLQALGWVQERGEKGNLSNDDYVMAMEKIVKDLEAAGIDIPDGKLTRAVLMDPRVAEVMSTTMAEMKKRPVATIESVTTQTEIGREAAALVERARQSGDVAAVKQYDTIVHRSLDSLITRRSDLGKLSVADVVLDAIIGQKSKLSRMEKGMGTFEGSITPNVRIPLPSMLTDAQRGAFLAVFGRALRQKATVAALFTAAGPRSVPIEGQVRTFSVFVQGHITDDAIHAFQKALPAGHEVSVKKVPNGVEIQVNPRFSDDGNPVGVSRQDMENAAKDVFLLGKSKIFSFDFKSDYFEDVDYGAALSAAKKEYLDEEANTIASAFKILSDGSKPADPVKAARDFLRRRGLGPKAAGNIGRAESVRARYGARAGDIARAEKEVRKVGDKLDKKLDGWNKKHGPRLLSAEGGP